MTDSTIYANLTPEELWRIGQNLFRDGRFSDARQAISGITRLAEESAEIVRHGETLNNPDVAVVVVSGNDVPLNKKCLQSIAREVQDIPGEVVLVDNGNASLLKVARDTLRQFTYVRLPANMGASVGRNVGANFSTSRNVVFVDDDGILGPGSIAAFMRVREQTGCSMVRGKVVPLTKISSGAPAHYDLGDYRRPYFLNCEGIACVDRDVFRAVGGFDPLLFGHEGVELCARAWPFVGPSGFYYEPGAVLEHDYADTPDKLADKKARYKLMDEYLAFRSPQTMEIYKPYRSSFEGDHRSVYSIFVSTGRRTPGAEAPISVITTAYNAAHFIEDYVKSWKLQKYSNFEVVLVDDGSDDGTADLADELTWDDDRFRIVRGDRLGRGGALNRAIEEARHDILVVADVDDLSVPQRLSLVNHEMVNPATEIVSFITFNEQNLSRQGGFPKSCGFNDFRVRSLFGMPGQFPSYAFRRSAHACAFSSQLKGGVDCDWLRRVLKARPDMGVKLVQVPVVYYRQSNNQISQAHRDVQVRSREKLILSNFESVLGTLTERDREIIHAITDRKIGTRSLHEIVAWSNEFTTKNRSAGRFDDENLCWALSDAIHDLAVAPPAKKAKNTPSAKPHLLTRREKLAREVKRVRVKMRLLFRNPGLGK